MRRKYLSWADAEALRGRITAFIRRSSMPKSLTELAWHFRMSKGRMGHQLRMLVRTVTRTASGKFTIAKEARKAA